MQRKGIWILGLVLLAAGLAPAVWAESHEEAAAPAAPQLFFVWTDHVPMANGQAYETEVKRMMAEMRATEAGKGIEFSALSNANGYSWVMPMAELNDFMKINQQMMAAIEEAGGLEAWDTASELVDHGSGQLIALRPDLSYTPAEPREAEAKGQFRVHEWWYVKPGHEPAIEDVARRIKAMYEEKGIDTGWRIYQAITGDDLPLYVVASTGMDPAEYWANDAKVNAALGEAAMGLIQEAASHARRMERTTAVMRPDLSMGM